MSANDIQRAVPHSIESEQYVIGALLFDNDAIDRIGDLRAEHFYRGDHRAIYAEIVSMLAEGHGADVLTVFERLKAQGRADDLGGLPYLNSMATDTPSSAGIARWAKIIRDRAQKRGLLTVAAEIQESIASPDDAAALIDRAASRLEALGEARVKREPKRASEGLSAHLNVLERRMNGNERVIPTGLIDLDKALSGGLRPEWNVVLAARPSMGKTALALNIATNVARDHSVLFLSMEMPEPEIHDRCLASLGEVGLDQVMASHEDDGAYWKGVTKATQKINDLNLYIDDQGALTLMDVRTKARAVKRKHGLDLVVVDYLQLMAGDGDNRNEQISVISRGLKALAKELKVCVICLSQLNRKVEERANKIPMMSDLRDSGSIEQDADAVVFLHREEVSNPDCGEGFRGFAQVRIAKFRHGRTGDVALAYDGPHVTFKNHIGVWPSNAAPTQRKRGGFDE